MFFVYFTTRIGMSTRIYQFQFIFHLLCKFLCSFVPAVTLPHQLPAASLNIFTCTRNICIIMHVCYLYSYALFMTVGAYPRSATELRSAMEWRAQSQLLHPKLSAPLPWYFSDCYFALSLYYTFFFLCLFYVITCCFSLFLFLFSS
jgi:hypothetical protein